MKFDPNRHQDGLLEAFDEFAAQFSYVYDALNREAPNALQPAHKVVWVERDKRKVFLGRYSDRNLQKRYEDMTAPEERESMTFTRMVEKFRREFRLNSNTTLANFRFRKLQQLPDESFDVFAIRVRREAAGCDFKCDSEICHIRDVMIRDQLIFGTSDNGIREKALAEQWKLTEMIGRGKSIEAATKSAAAIKEEPIAK